MTRNLLLLLLSLLWLPTLQAQLLTEIRDTTSELNRSRVYLMTGSAFRFDLGYSQMKQFYESQGFDTPLPLFISLGIGGVLSERVSLELFMEAGFDSDVREFRDGSRSSLEEGSLGMHALLGYRLLQHRKNSLLIQAGVSGLFRIVRISQQLPETFDFNNVYSADAPSVRNWPSFNHGQGALHVALQYKLKAPGPRWWTNDVDLKIGFVSGLNARSWSVNPGNGLNIPVDNAQYVYFSSALHLFARTGRSWK